jgi:regulator of sirC expression with transglutaminase-like and TPR domain
LLSADLLSAAEPAPKSVEQVAASARKSLAVISFAGRDGKRQGLGTGFVVAAEGLLATNLHVLGEARPITVELADGKKYPVISVHASDRVLDLALIRIDAKNLQALELADSDLLKEGQAVVAMGNPQGLTHSVVSGVVSARRQVEGRPMIQLAIPIETGNSGGPLLDMHGRVHGILTMKSLLTPNLGFAVPINLLKPLLKKPNPIPMSRWLTIGTLDPAEWTPLFEGRWKQRAGRIIAEGLGSGFGGRTLCLSRRTVPALPYELAVTVKLDDEAGAAGLVFCADGGDRHYGFYPSGGRLRLTRFDGPDVYSWTILEQKPSPRYRPGDWNTLKVRLEKGKFFCYVNGHLLVESTDSGLTGGKVGLAKFRDTHAEFKNFQVAREIPAPNLSADLAKRIHKSVDSLAPQTAPNAALIDTLLPDATASISVLRERAKQLDQQAAQLRELAQAVHQKQVQSELIKALQPKETEIDLIYAALLVAKLDNDELDVEAYRKEIDRMVRDLKAGLPKDADEQVKLAALNRYLFAERGFHGSRHDYYNRSNSYLNEVIDDREGLPITLSVLYLELARRLGLNVVGIGLPKHFVVKFAPTKGEAQLLDVYEGAKRIPQAEANRLVQAEAERPARQHDFAAVPKKAIVIRMLHNLLGLAADERDLKASLRYLDMIVAIDPAAANERLLRASARIQNGNTKGALEDVDWLMEHHPEGINEERILEFRRLLTRPER